MIIERIVLFAIRMPLVHFFETSVGRKTHRSALIVRVDAEGVVGYGECPPDNVPLYAGETVDTCALMLERHFAPRVLGEAVESVDDVLRLVAPIRGNAFARAGLEAACADALARARGISLRELYGGVRDTVDVGVSLGIQDSTDELLARVAAFVGEGYRRVKLKIRPGWDVDVVRRVREEYPELALMVDANAAYGIDAHESTLSALDELGLMMIEQPFHPADLVDHARMQARLRTPICLDESVTSRQLARAALKLGAARVINIKAPRVGGATEARAIHDLCREASVPVWCGGLLETGIGRAHNLALASLPGFTLPGDISASSRYYERDVIEPAVTLRDDGTVAVPASPGLGFEVVEARIREHAFAERELVAGS